MKKLLTITLLLLLPLIIGAELFTSTDGNLNMDLPYGWKEYKSNKPRLVLDVRKDTSQIEIKTLNDCTDEKCLEQKANKDIRGLKNKGYAILENSYTDEIINKTEFSTGELFLFFNFTGNVKDYSVGYFMLNQKTYSIFAQGISHAESEVIFSFISPAIKRSNVDATKKAYAIDYNYGDVETTDIAKIDKNQNPILVEKKIEPKPESESLDVEKVVPSVLTEPVEEVVQKKSIDYLKKMQSWTSIVAIVIFIYIAIMILALITKMFITDKENFDTPNASSHYPFNVLRLYGTPEIIYKLKNNQGSIFIALHSRWGYLLSSTGVMFLLITFAFMIFAKIMQGSVLFETYPLIHNSIFGLGQIIVPFGLFLFVSGFFVRNIVDKSLYVYDSDGNLVYIVSKIKSSLFEKRFVAYDKNENVLFYLKRARFLALRSWKIYDDGNNLVVRIKEKSLIKSLARKLLGHLFGLLRAEYSINSENKTKGTTKTSLSMWHNFTINTEEKSKGLYPEEMMLICLAVNVFDIDKFHISTN